MPESVSGSIDRFIRVFEGVISVVTEEIPDSRVSGVHRKVLLAAMLDAMSFPLFRRSRNRDRFISFVLTYAGWESAERVSLPHLAQLSRLAGHSMSASLRSFAISRMSGWIPGERIPVARDPSFDEVVSHWPVENGTPIRLMGVAPESLRHVNLLYAYRNALVHEFRQLGHDLEMWDTDDAYYTHLTRYSDLDEPGEQSWQLQYPVRFLVGLCRTALANLETQLRTQETNPFDQYDWSSYWLPPL